MPPATVRYTGLNTFSPEGLAAAFRQYGESLRPAALRAAKQISPLVQREAIRRFSQRGVGKAIFGGAEKGAFKIIKAAAALRGDVVVVGLELRGFAALQEMGGRTKAHDIRPKRRKALRFKMAGGGWGAGEFNRSRAFRKFDAHSEFARRVHHPGSAIKRIPFASEAFLATQGAIKALFEKELTKFRTGGVAIVSSRAA